MHYRRELQRFACREREGEGEREKAICITRNSISFSNSCSLSYRFLLCRVCFFVMKEMFSSYGDYSDCGTDMEKALQSSIIHIWVCFLSVLLYWEGQCLGPRR